MPRSISICITAHSTSPLGCIISISNQMFKAKIIFTLLRKGREEGIRGSWGSDTQTDYDLVSPVGPSSGRECLGPADMDIWVPKTTAFSLSVTSITWFFQTECANGSHVSRWCWLHAQAGTCPLTLKYFQVASASPQWSMPHTLSVGLFFLFSFSFHLPRSPAHKASWWSLIVAKVEGSQREGTQVWADDTQLCDNNT